MSLVSQIGSLALGLVHSSVWVRIALSLLILGAGFLLSRFAGRAVEELWQRNVPQSDIVERLRKRHDAPDREVEYVILILAFLASLFLINAPDISAVTAFIPSYASSVATSLLIIAIGVLTGKTVVSFIRALMERSGIEDRVDSMGFSAEVLDGVLTGVKFLIYLFAVQLAVVQLGASPIILQHTVLAGSLGAVLLLVLLGFFGFREVIANYAAGIYLRGAEGLKPGKRVRIGGESGEIREISRLGTTIAMDSGYFMLAPNKDLMGEELYFKRVRMDVEALEDIRNYFVSDTAEGMDMIPAEIALAVLGFDITRGDMEEEMEDSDHPRQMGEAIASLTDEEVLTAFISAEQISDLETDAKTWLDNGSLLIPYFDGETLFPGSEGSRYALSVAVEGGEMLLIDPEKNGSGEVYYMGADEVQAAMESVDDGGYVVLAPRGSTGFWRIRNGLIYTGISDYTGLSKDLEVQLRKIVRRGKALKYVVPQSVDDFIRRWELEEEFPVSGFWKSGRSGDEDLDESTRSS